MVCLCTHTHTHTHTQTLTKRLTRGDSNLWPVNEIEFQGTARPRFSILSLSLTNGNQLTHSSKITRLRWRAIYILWPPTLNGRARNEILKARNIRLNIFTTYIQYIIPTSLSSITCSSPFWMTVLTFDHNNWHLICSEAGDKKQTASTACELSPTHCLCSSSSLPPANSAGFT